MKQFTKQLLFISISVAVLVVGGLVIYGATAGGGLKVNPILGHDLDLDAKYYGQAGNNTVHDITTQDISISAWVKVDVDSGASNQYIAYKHGATTGYYLRLDATTGKLHSNLNKDVSNTYSLTGNTDLRDNKWHYVSVIFDRDTTANCKLFIDGVDNTATRGTAGQLSAIDNITNTSLYYIGLTSQNLDGQIRDVKLYYASGDHWSDAQVLYQAQHPFDYSTNAGTLTDYWRLDEGSGTTLYGKVNNLTLSNVLAWTTQPKLKVVKQENTTTTSNNPVGWWKMDEGTGQYAYDVSGNGNTGTLGTSTSADGADPTWTTGKLGKGLSFDGVNDCVSGNTTGFSYTTGTIEMWTKPVNPNDKYLFMIGSFNSNMIAIDTDEGNINSLHLHLQNSVGGSLNTASYSIPSNIWTHIVGVYSPTNVKLYINGNLFSSVNGTSPVTVLGSKFYIASYNSAGVCSATYVFSGLIDDVRIYNRALTAGEVGQMWNSTKDGYLGKIKVTTGLVGYWKLDDNNALTSVIDYSGKGNTGTAYSGTATSTSVLSTSTAMIGRAMSFDGVDDYINAGTGSSLDMGLSDMTIEFWVNANNLTTNSIGLVSKRNTTSGSHSGYGIFTYNGLLFAQICNGITESAGSAGVFTMSLNQWHHLVIVFDRSANMTVYLDNVIKQTTDISGYVNDNIITATSLLFGRNYTSYFNGLIDEVKIWNYARSAEQIGQDYIRGLKGLP